MYRRKNIQPILKALYVFEAVARNQSFTKAALHLGMPQPSVSRFIANLESFIGTPLFHRKHNRIEITPSGDALLKATELGLGHIRTVVETLMREQTIERLSIVCTHGFAHMWVLPRIELLRTLLPGWDIRLNTSDQPQDADFDDADIVIRFGAGDWTGIHASLLFEEEVFPVCSPDLLSEYGMQQNLIQPGDLSALPLIALDFGEFGWVSWLDLFNAFEIGCEQLPEIHPVPSYHFILQSATEGKGVALAWSHLTEPYLSNGWLVELPNMRLRTGKAYYAIFAPDHPQKDAIVQWLAACRMP